MNWELGDRKGAGKPRDIGHIRTHTERPPTAGPDLHKDDRAAGVWELCPSSLSLTLGNLVYITSWPPASICIRLLGLLWKSPTAWVASSRQHPVPTFRTLELVWNRL